MDRKPHLMVVDAPYYQEISKELRKGVLEVLAEAGASHEIVEVPGVLEIPAAISFAVSAGKAQSRAIDGFIVIGCVIRGETTHYDIVANESARAIMHLAVNHQLAIGNGIQTVENEDQAWARAKVDDKNKGGGAARAALAMIELRQKLHAANV